MDNGGCFPGVYREGCFLGGIAALNLSIRCFKGVSGDQGCESIYQTIML